MNDLETCREQILSEDTRDFISNPLRTPLFNELLKKDPCTQDAGLGYQCIYFSKELVEPISLARFSYNSIPNCFAPVAMETLNQTGILPVQNYPALQLKGKGVLIGFLDSGIDYQNKVFRNLDGTTRIAAIWDQTIQSGTPPRDFFYGSEYRKEEIDLALSSDSPLSQIPSVDVHDQQVAVGDAVVLHAVARDPSGECRTRIADQLPIQVEGRVEVVVGRRGKTRRDAACRHGKFRVGRGVGADEPEPYFFLVVHLVIHSRCKIAKNFV